MYTTFDTDHVFEELELADHTVLYGIASIDCAAGNEFCDYDVTSFVIEAADIVDVDGETVLPAIYGSPNGKGMLVIRKDHPAFPALLAALSAGNIGEAVAEVASRDHDHHFWNDGDLRREYGTW